MAKKRKVRRKKVMRKAVRRVKRNTARRSSVLAKMSTPALEAELARRRDALPKLRTRAEALEEELEALRVEMASLGEGGGGAPPRGGRGGARRRGTPGRKRAGARVTKGGRPRNAASLEEYLARVLKGKTMGVKEVATAVQRAGYRTTSPNFRTIVNQTLTRSDKIKKLSRGKYTAA